MRNFTVLGVSLGLLPSQTLAAGAEMAPQLYLDHVWTMICAALVLLMQVGFMLLEAGSVRSKNSVNVAQKNLMDFLLSTTMFGIVGFTLMFGASQGGWFGWSSDLFFFGVSEDWALTFFVFQLMFCGTASTIVSGAVAERMTVGAYLLLVALMGALLYPIAGHWAWGGLLSGDDAPFLAQMGFMDFAGSTVVHSVGAWVALAAVILIGPRIGRFDANGNPVTLHGHSPILAAAGALLIWVGWIGFNGGSTTAGSPAFAGIIANTMVAGAIGGVTTGIIGYLRKGFHRPEFAINGILAGLVGITAGCDVVSVQGAAIIGGIAAIVYHFARRWLTDLGLDDPIGAISVHGFAGATGTLLVAFIAPSEALLAGSRFDQALVQLTGIGIFFVWAFGFSFLALLVMDQILRNDGAPRGRGLRVTVEDERIGLNEAEHRTPLGLNRLTNAMQAIVENEAAEIAPLSLDPGDETFEPSFLFNKILERQQERQRKDELRRRAVSDVLEDVQTVLSAVSRGNLDARMSGTSEEFVTLIDGMNGLLAEMSHVVSQSAAASKKAQASAKKMTAQSRDFEKNSRSQVNHVDSIQKTLDDLRTRILRSNDALRSALGMARDVADTNADVRAASAKMMDRIAKSVEIVATIGQSIDDIDDVALQTHLLSINASVEASRRNDASTKGFTVVAEEIRSLAGQTAQTARSIRNLIKDVQARSNDAEAQVTVTDGALVDLTKKNDVIAATVQELDAINAEILQSLNIVGETINVAKLEAGALLNAAAQSETVAAELLQAADSASETIARFSVDHAETPDRAA